MYRHVSPIPGVIWKPQPPICYLTTLSTRESHSLTAQQPFLAPQNFFFVRSMKELRHVSKIVSPIPHNFLQRLSQPDKATECQSPSPWRWTGPDHRNRKRGVKKRNSLSPCWYLSLTWKLPGYYWLLLPCSSAGATKQKNQRKPLRRWTRPDQTMERMGRNHTIHENNGTPKQILAKANYHHKLACVSLFHSPPLNPIAAR